MVKIRISTNIKRPQFLSELQKLEENQFKFLQIVWIYGQSSGIPEFGNFLLDSYFSGIRTLDSRKVLGREIFKKLDS